MILYRVEFFGDPRIVKMEVAGRTAKQVVLMGGRREAIESEYHFWAQSREEAKTWLVEICTGDVELAKGRLAVYEKRLEQAKNL